MTLLRRLGLLAASLFLLIGVAAPVSASPDAVDHLVPGYQSFAICEYIREGAGYVNYEVVIFRTIHYGTAHVTQCGMRNTIIRHGICYQHVWGTEGFQIYESGPYVTCW